MATTRQQESFKTLLSFSESEWIMVLGSFPQQKNILCIVFPDLTPFTADTAVSTVQCDTVSVSDDSPNGCACMCGSGEDLKPTTDPPASHNHEHAHVLWHLSRLVGACAEEN